MRLTKGGECLMVLGLGLNAVADVVDLVCGRVKPLSFQPVLHRPHECRSIADDIVKSPHWHGPMPDLLVSAASGREVVLLKIAAANKEWVTWLRKRICQ